MPYDVYESKGYARDGYVDKKIEHAADRSEVKTKGDTLTSYEAQGQLTEREIEKQNMKTLRTEYHRYVSGRGMSNYVTNPFIPLGTFRPNTASVE